METSLEQGEEDHILLLTHSPDYAVAWQYDDLARVPGPQRGLPASPSAGTGTSGKQAMAPCAAQERLSQTPVPGGDWETLGGEALPMMRPAPDSFPNTQRVHTMSTRD